VSFSPTKGAIRFGEGLSPDVAPPTDQAAIIAQLDGGDIAASIYPIIKFSEHLPVIARIETLRRASRKGRKGADADELRKAFHTAFKPLQRDMDKNFARCAARSITSTQPFRERLTRFWADHFTVIGKEKLLRSMVPAYVEEAIRPNIVGSFSRLLRAAILHPMMLTYLDQSVSVGPNSRAAKGRRGLNENLARELLELHTLGVEGTYSQQDVRQLAELLTGLTANLKNGFMFRPKMAEPGAEQVLGGTYGGIIPDLQDIFSVLDDLSTHPETAAHLARKLAVHFVSDDPPERLVSELTRRYLDTDGDLRAVYEALVEHPDTWSLYGKKVKQPIDFIYSTMRALRVPPRTLGQQNRKTINATFGQPLAAMGQSWMAPPGPDGWPEAALDWLGVQGLAARLQWSMVGPSAIFRALPDPRDFAVSALGELADERVLFAAKSAENRREGIGLILASPAFQRR
jgi:uncharacterized protein (DUF1800 family)